MTKLNILQEADKLCNGDRQKSYDSPENNYAQIAQIASAILRKNFSPREIAVIMIATKLSRESHQHKRDNLVDLAGYAWVLSRLEGDEL